MPLDTNRKVREALQARGGVYGKVETWNPGMGASFDLFGLFDFVHVLAGQVTWIQVTTRSHYAEHAEKFLDNHSKPNRAPFTYFDATCELLASGGHIEIWLFEQKDGPRTPISLEIIRLVQVDDETFDFVSM